MEAELIELETVNITEDGGVVKKIFEQGDPGTKPEKGQQVSVHYEGRLEDGTVFDGSYDFKQGQPAPGRDPLEVSIGEGQVIQGWDLGIMSMNIGEKADLVIKSDYGYGDNGSPPKIPGGATLIFTVELLEVEGKKAQKYTKSDEELLETAMQNKNDGATFVGKKEFAQAADHYQVALNYLEICAKQTEEITKLRVVCNQNMAICLNNQGKHGDAIRFCNAALAIDPNAVKALMLRGNANLGSKNFDEASADIKAAIKLAPGDKGLRQLFEKIKAEKKKYSQNEQANMQKMFAKGLYNEKDGPSNVKRFDKLPAFDQDNSQVFFDIQIGEGEEQKGGKVTFELFTKQVPKTAENFRAICTGEKGDGLHYLNNIFHRVIKGFMAQGGDITAQNGTGGKSIYGHKFADEQIWYPHTHKGALSMANAGPDTNGSQFFILFGPTPHLNEKHTVYGRVIKGYDVIEMIEENPTAPGDKPLKDVKVVGCGELKGDDKLTKDTADFLASYDE